MHLNLLSEKTGRVTTVEKLLEASDISLSEREIIKAKVNKREVAMNKQDWTTELTELFQIVAELRLKHELLWVDMKQMLFDIFQEAIPILPTKVYKDWPLLAQIVHTDLHIERLEHRNKNYLKEIDDRTMRLFEKLMKHNPDMLLYVNLWDYFNSDTDSKTTRGTPQQNYLPERDSFRLWLEHQIALIKSLSAHIHTEVVYIPGNHDRSRLQSLSDAVDLYFAKTLEVDSDNLERKYKTWGDNALGYCHGDGIKNKQIPLTMQQETKLKKHNHFFKWHWHTRFVEELGSVLIQQLPSPAHPSAWEINLWHSGRGKIYWQLIDKKQGKIWEFMT